MFWGSTPALDLLEEYVTIKKDVPETINILIVGSTDCRHILKTEARKYRHKVVKVNFFVVEACVEMIARQLLLLNIALQPQESLGLDQKTKIFMELYGNSLIRPAVAKCLNITAASLINMVTDYSYLEKMMNFVKLEIKYKERDYLENLLKFWCAKDDFDICNIWDKRVRKNLGVRYDSKVGAFDWDLNMRLHDVGAKQICSQEYRNFRSKGVSFSWLESEVSRPNRTLVCAIMPNGTYFVHYGYLGDILNGPFVNFGLECEDKSLLKSVHGQNYFRATDVTERNLKQIFYEIQNQEPYNLRKTSETQMGNIVMKEDNLVVDTRGLEFVPRPTKKCIDIDDNITIFSSSILEIMRYKDKYHDKFDMIYFGNAYLHFFDKEIISKISKPGSVLYIEHQLFLVTNRKKELEEFKDKIEETMKGLDFDRLEFNFEKEAYAKFILK
ncbi:unnamed protein product [Psylliodes chrysocephalus]|uniref:Dynein assembly factor 3, axonemal n=1 Tax=Psylliodes chrysocephalus TaxID=3402493 RepID=A0A9P0GET2_9CUCU|nr:unnamed protein product [Psylliodes chrysocephala]